jgi:SAM-dependent methyltransferase
MAGVTVPLYDALADDYDRFVNWPERLARELPFLEGIFRELGVKRVLDAACGTGWHAIALAQRGYQAAGADLSLPMVQLARENARRAGVDVPFLAAGLGHLTGAFQSAEPAPHSSTLPLSHSPKQSACQSTTLPPPPFDALLCLGNSLPHLLTAEAVAGALADFAALLQPGGLAVIQNRNFDRVMARRQRFMDPQSHQSPEGEWIFVRFYDFHDETITFNMIRLRRTEGRWAQDLDSTELHPLRREELAEALAAAGFGRVAFYGGYDGSAFDPAQSGDLIVVAALDRNTPKKS